MIAEAPAPKMVQDDFYHHLFRPFLLPEAAAGLLGFSAKHVIRLARDGELRGFNLAVSLEEDAAEMDERDPRSMIRLLRRHVEMLRAPQLFVRAGRPVSAADFDLQDDLLHRRASFSIWEVTHTFDCSDDHVRRLVGKRLLTGPALSVVSERRHVSRESLLTFLRQRELTHL